MARSVLKSSCRWWPTWVESQNSRLRMKKRNWDKHSGYYLYIMNINNLFVFIVNISPVSASSTSQFLDHSFTYAANGLCNVKMKIKISYLHRLYVVQHYAVAMWGELWTKGFILMMTEYWPTFHCNFSVMNCVLYRHDNWLTII